MTAQDRRGFAVSMYSLAFASLVFKPPTIPVVMVSQFCHLYEVAWRFLHLPPNGTSAELTEDFLPIILHAGGLQRSSESRCLDQRTAVLG